MDRKSFLQYLAALPVAHAVHKLNELNRIITPLGNTKKMPVLFLGHGSPMNAIEENEFVRGFRKAGNEIPKPNAILCISAHWETRGTFVTAMKQPRTIHDFGDFPQELYNVRYPAPGSPQLAKDAQQAITKTKVGLDEKWGLDHGAWSVIKHLYPEADIPVIQLSIDATQGPRYHYELAKELAELRNKGILVIGSGNMVHNLGMMAWDRLNDESYGYDWALDARSRMNNWILSGDHRQLIEYRNQGKSFELAVPTPEHFIPLLYVLALKNNNDKVTLFNDKAIAGSITMTSVKIDSL